MSDVGSYKTQMLMYPVLCSLRLILLLLVSVITRCPLALSTWLLCLGIQKVCLQITKRPMLARVFHNTQTVMLKCKSPMQGGHAFQVHPIPPLTTLAARA